MNYCSHIIQKLCIFLVFLCLPLQTLGPIVFNTRVDISSIILVCLLPILSTKRLVRAFLTCFVLIVFTSCSLQLLYYIDVPVSRVIASAGFFSILLSLMIAPTVIAAHTIECMSLGLRASFFVFVAGYFIFSFSGNQFGTFTESSFASLYLAAYIASETIQIVCTGKAQLYSSIVISAALPFLFLSEGIHVLTIILSFFLIYAFVYLQRFLLYFSRARLPLNIVPFAASVLLFSFIVIASIDSSRISDRIISLLNPSNLSNLSSLVWIGGASQMMQSLVDCPITGCGAGSPGYFSQLPISMLISKYIPSVNIPLHYLPLIDTLNVLDAYSLFFRSIVEFGLFAIVLWAWVIKRILLCSQFLLISKSANLLPALRIIVFSLVCIIGSLIKEPNLFSSITFPPVMIGVITAFHVYYHPLLNTPKRNITL